MRIERFIIVLLVSVCGTAMSQDDLVDLDTISLEHMDSMGYRNYHVPDDLYFSNYSGNVQRPEDKKVNKDDFYPIGWSKDGLFAFAVEAYAENCNCNFTEFYIQDLKTDEVLWKHYYNNEAYQVAWHDGDRSTRDSLRKVHSCYYMKCLWYTLYDTIAPVLFEHGIIPEQRSSYRMDLDTDEKFYFSFLV